MKSLRETPSGKWGEKCGRGYARGEGGGRGRGVAEQEYQLLFPVFGWPYTF